ncbi:hypothetical protein [Tenacibaculum piscium]|uniref:hypothetical protein n=1 Tax=Tenacibaculum piscium TaxID=1458515 RepID=UPI001F373E3C|nr:hypothetical protein [Tenacibaculum piscium]
MNNLEKKINETFDYAVYLHMVGCFVPNTDYKEIKEIVDSVHNFIKNNDSELIESRLPTLKAKLIKITNQFIEKFPLKCSVSEIATEWNGLFKDKKDDYNVLSTGMSYGWLEQFMDLSNLYTYNYVPYHYRIGIFAHKGLGSIEESFLLNDSFNFLVKSQHYFELLLKYREILKKEEKKGNLFTSEKRNQATNLNLEIASNSRLTIISFYSFIECFVNSIGHNYALRNSETINEKTTKILEGMKNNGYLSLKSKIENFQKIIRKDEKIIIKTTDKKQLKEPFKSFFENYEELRNASVHYSPTKERIWLKPHDWIEKVNDFSKITIEVAILFWKSCFPELKEPDYLERLDYSSLFYLAKKRQNSILLIEKELTNE